MSTTTNAGLSFNVFIMFTTLYLVKRLQKEWIQPTNARPPPQLYIQNSLTRQKELFVPNEGRKVSIKLFCNVIAPPFFLGKVVPVWSNCV